MASPKLKLRDQSQRLRFWAASAPDVLEEGRLGFARRFAKNPHLLANSCSSLHLTAF